MCKERGLKLIMRLPFEEVFEKYSPSHGDKLEKTGVLSRGKLMLSEEELEVTKLYLAFCFQKIVDKL